ncbi:hypothetical protein, partial [Acetobacter tropicalis]|uniref:hypothetical protein n=1 Tax=Acetobacter tropicalis TaxID=104102 RepID=UPI0020CFB2CB
NSGGKRFDLLLMNSSYLSGRSASTNPRAIHFQRDSEILKQFWISPSGSSASGSSASNTIWVVTSPTASTTASTSATAFRNQIAHSLAGGANASTCSACRSRVWR